MTYFLTCPVEPILRSALSAACLCSRAAISSTSQIKIKQTRQRGYSTGLAGTHDSFHKTRRKLKGKILMLAPTQHTHSKVRKGWRYWDRKELSIRNVFNALQSCNVRRIRVSLEPDISTCCYLCDKVNVPRRNVFSRQVSHQFSRCSSTVYKMSECWSNIAWCYEAVWSIIQPLGF